MNQKKKCSIFLILLAMIIPLFSGFVPQKQVYAEETWNPNGYYGTTKETTARLKKSDGTDVVLLNPIYIGYPGREDLLTVGYCIEAEKAYPKVGQNVDFQGNRYDIEQLPTEEWDNIGQKSLNNPREGHITATNGIKNALYRGYPIDATGIQGRYRLTDDEFWALTQMAVHYWSDSYYNQHGNPITNHTALEMAVYNDLRKEKGLPDFAGAYDELISKVGVDAPMDLQMSLYIPQTKNNEQGHEYQRIVSTEFKERQIKFQKVDDEGNPIPNVEFTIQRKEDFLKKLPQPNRNYNTEYHFTTGEDGTIETILSGNPYDEQRKSLGLIFGNYVLTEVNTPSGYQGLTQPITFTITQNRAGNPEFQINNQDNHPDKAKIKGTLDKETEADLYPGTPKGFTIRVTNEKKGFDFQFKKTKENDEPLGEATFQILNKDNQTEVATFTSDEQGTYQSVILPEGSYILKESVTPDTYQTMPELEFRVSNQGVLTFTDQELAKKYVTTQSEPEKKYDIKNIPKIDEPQATIKTQVEVNGKKSEDKKPVTVKTDGKDTVISFTDYLTYEGLVEGEDYLINAYLYEVHPDGTIVDNSINPLQGMISRKYVSKEFTAEAGEHIVEIPFNSVTIQPGVKYVVMETVISENEIDFKTGTKKHTLEHKNAADDLQTFYGAVKNPESSISTVVEVDGKKSTEMQPLQLDITSDKTMVNVTDHLTYENLIAGKTYVATAYLWEIKEDGSTVNPLKPIDIRRVSTAPEFVATGNGGTIDFEFKDIELSAGSTYVVTQTLTSIEDIPLEAGFGPHKVEHNLDLKDKAQTFTIKQVPKQTLTVEKQVTGFSGDKQKEFNFNLTVNPDQYLLEGTNLTAKLYKKDGETIAATDQEITVGKQYTFNLKDGEHLEVQGLYENMTYTLNEVEFGQDGYTTTVMVNNEKKADADTNPNYTIAEGDNKVVFTNHNGKIVPTGILLNSAPYLAGVAFVALSGIILRLSRRRKKLK